MKHVIKNQEQQQEKIVSWDLYHSGNGIYITANGDIILAVGQVSATFYPEDLAKALGFKVDVE